jgi:hypothetical protein
MELDYFEQDNGLFLKETTAQLDKLLCFWHSRDWTCGVLARFFLASLFLLFITL